MTGPKTNNQAHQNPGETVCGIDEVGRGPLAGPVVAAAVILPPGFDTTSLKDSKALTPEKRDLERARITAAGIPLGIGWVWPAEIDEINIHRAALLAMERAWRELREHHAAVVHLITETLVDGLHLPRGLEGPARAIVGGDGTVPAIMAASIIAKTIRDEWMVDYSRRDDRYGFERHKGYPTAAHKAALQRYGPCPIHRRSFRGVVQE